MRRSRTAACFGPVAVTLDGAGAHGARRVYSAEAASLVANILADADARALEFGRDSVLAFPVQTAVKTGTSNDFRDAWAVGFNHRYTVGVWMGNLDQTPTDGVTGSIGPALLLRSVFAELTRDAETRPLYLVQQARARRGVRADAAARIERRRMPAARRVVRRRHRGAGAREERTETASRSGCASRRRGCSLPTIRAFRPRRRCSSSRCRAWRPQDRVRWTVDGREIEKVGATYGWSVTRGDHRVAAAVWQGGELVASLDETVFHVK